MRQGNAVQARPPWWMWVVSGMVGCAIGLWFVPPTSSGRQGFTPPQVAVPVGTSGRHVTTRSADEALAAAGDLDPQPGTIREIETITGVNDGMALVGRRVDLHVDVQARANDTAFWVGPRDNRVLVVLARNDRGARQPQAETAGRLIVSMEGGRRAVVAGVIRPVSEGEDVETWNLTDADRAELGDRKIYIRADAVRSEGEGRL